VTHELKTPLASTRLLVETLLHADKLEEQPTREYLELIARENIRLSRLIDNFLTFSRIERNKYTFDFKEVSAGSIAGAAVTAVRERFQSSGCHFEVKIPSDLPSVRADADAMVTALLNLLDNAYKYSGGSKQIGFRVGAENGAVTFSVSDNGIGLSPRDAKQVFKRFYQVNQHMSRSSGGAGLGLSIVQFIVSAHHGAVQVVSELERGSTFTVQLPVADRSPIQEARS
jgi:signal transduction histidine kinase